MDEQTFVQRFEAIKKQGWIPSKRQGPTGIGFTLETALGLTETNVAVPDLGTIELKAHRVGTQSLITLFTFNRAVWKMHPLTAIRRYGTPDKNPAKNGRMGLYFTMSHSPNSAGLYLESDQDTIRLRHTDGAELAVWTFEALMERFIQKIPALILVSAYSQVKDNVEYFQFYRAQLMRETSSTILRTQLEAGTIFVDLRLHDRGNRVRNHGTGFRVPEHKLALLFSDVRDL